MLWSGICKDIDCIVSALINTNSEIDDIIFAGNIVSVWWNCFFADQVHAFSGNRYVIFGFQEKDPADC